MNPFRKLPGFVTSAPGLEWALWRLLPALLLWGTLLPLLIAGVRWWAAPHTSGAGTDAALLLWTYKVIGAVVLHWTLILTLAIGCWIVIVMKGPAYVADAYPMPDADAPDRGDKS